MFCTYHPIEARPLLEKLSDAGYGKANALLFWLLTDGYYENQQYMGDDELAWSYLKIGYEAGDPISSLLYAIKENNKEVAERFLSQVEKLAEEGNIFAEYTLGVVAESDVFGETNYFGAVQHFINTYQIGFYRAAGSIFLRYYYGDAPFKKDWIRESLGVQKL